MKITQNKASALIVSLMILSMLIIISLSVALNAARERVSSIGSAKSSQSFQSADTGIEKVMFEISQISNPSDTVEDASFSDCNGDTGLIEESNNEYSVELKDVDGNKIDCDDSAFLVSDIFSLKSVGFNSGTERAISAQFPRKASSADSETKLLIHSDTTDGDTNFEDSGGGDNSPHLITPNGNVHHETSESRFGATSMYFDGTGDYLTINDSEDWNFGSDDFTIDFWIKPDILTINQMIMVQNDGLNAFWTIWIWDSARLGFHFRTPIVGPTDSGLGRRAFGPETLDTSWQHFPLDTSWQHIAIVRSGDMFYMFIGGELVAFENDIKSFPDYINDLEIGKGYYGWNDFRGYIDELRISKGVARWTSNFTVPDEPYGSP